MTDGFGPILEVPAYCIFNAMLIAGPPTIVNVSVHVITISAISEVSMDYTLDLYLRQFWHDSRLMFEAIQDHDNLTGPKVHNSMNIVLF